MHCIAASAVPEREGLGGGLGGCIVTSVGGVWPGVRAKRVKPGKGRDVVELGRPVKHARVVI